MLRFFISTLILATPFAVVTYWLSGAIGGFRLNDKLTPRWKRTLRLYGIVALFSGGGAVGVASMRGCVTLAGMKAAVASASSPASSPTSDAIHNSHSLGNIAPPSFEILTRLKKEQTKQEREAAMKVIAQVETQLAFSNTFSPKSARSGPFCRVTCVAHHGGEYDVETLPELCRANWIPPKAYFVPGWYDAGMANMEFTNPWPGPAQRGFEKYKLYWSGLQSAAKVIHGSFTLAGPHT